MYLAATELLLRIRQAKTRVPPCILSSHMSKFVENATRILEAAEAAMRSGETPSALTFLIRPEGTLEMVADSDTPLDTLQMERGAAMVYRINQKNGRVRVEGRSGSSTCMFESEKPQAAVQRTLQRLDEVPVQICEATTTAVLPRARTWQPPPEEWD
jgi:hypothetical protein